MQIVFLFFYAGGGQRVDFCLHKRYAAAMKIAGFDWDDGNWPKCGKHGVSRTEIEQEKEVDHYERQTQTHPVFDQ